jgi:hypothetical protein
MPGERSAIGLVWDQQSVWSQAANRVKASIQRSRLLTLSLLVIAAVIGTTAAQVGGHSSVTARVLAFVAAAATGLSAVVSRSGAVGSTRDWIRLRSVSEALKSYVYLFLAGVSPFAGSDRDKILTDRLAKVTTAATDLRKYTVGITPVTRDLPSVSDPASYLTARLIPQADEYYRPKATELADRVRLLRGAQLTLATAGALLGAAAAAFSSHSIAAWVAVTTTVLTALAAYAAAERYEHQLVAYVQTADELDRLRLRPPGPEVVLASEHVISIENEAWMVELSKHA